MNFFEIAAWVIGSFFVAGIVVGFLIIEVLPGDEGHMDSDNWREPPRDEDEQPRWPGS